MTSERETYDNPLVDRYASPEMSRLWGPARKFGTWRRLWVALAEAEAELGLPITSAQIEQLRAHIDDIDFDAAASHERKLRHDVMAHVHAYGDVCPDARGIIHWGATSCYVTDNTDLILIRQSLELLRDRLVSVIARLADFARQHRRLACLGFTHLQPAQPTTVGKRASLWAYDLVQDLTELEHRLESLKARGVKGTTGTQASFLELFHGDHAKVLELERRVAAKLGFAEVYAVTGQTYSRKVDSQVLDVLSGIAQSASKAATDLRLLQSQKEVEEPFETQQIGSSAMAYKRNPMRAERICGLSRFVLSLQSSTAMTAATQWMERTLDDSANRRLVIPQAFLAIDAILMLYENVASGLVVYPRVIERHLQDELPFMATENLLMAAVAAGGDRQQLHERIRLHSQAAAALVKQQGQANDLLTRLAGDPAFAGVNIAAMLEPLNFVGRAPEQVDEFLAAVVAPILKRYPPRHEPAEVRV
jgi:adenylosuccinate lyase